MSRTIKRNVLGVLVDAVDYAGAVDRIVGAARERRGFAATALAVHGVMTGVESRIHRYRLNRLDLVTADGQAVRWALNLLHGAGLSDRVYGPRLMLEVCAAAAAEELPVFLYGSRAEVLDRLEAGLRTRIPGLQIAGAEPSKFRCTDPGEQRQIADRIRASGARITFVGLGCPRQEVFAFEYRDVLGMPVVAVGAAFDYHAGLLREPPPWVQQAGLQWCHRLLQEPRRLWKRYCVLNPLFLSLLVLQKLGLWTLDPSNVEAPSHAMLYG